MYIRQNMTRFVSAWDHANPWWYYLQYYWIDMAPWAFLTPLAVLLPGRDEKEKKLDLFSWIWIIGVIAFFSTSQSKRSAYILPIAPAVAFLASGIWVRLRAGLLPAVRQRVALAVHGMIAALMVLGGVAAVVKGLPKYPDLTVPVGALAAVMVLGGLTVLAGVIRPGWRRSVAPWGLVGLLIGFYLVASILVLPAADRFKSPREFSDEMNRIVPRDAPVASYRFWDWRAGYAFYSGRRIRNLKSPEELHEYWSGDGPVYLIVENIQVDEARALLSGYDPVLERKVGSKTVYLFGKKQTR